MMTPHRTAKVIAPDDGGSFWYEGAPFAITASREETGGAFGFMTGSVVAGGGPPRHVHSRDEEFFYVLDGQLTFEVGGHAFRGCAGAFISLPKGLPHRFHNASEREARMVGLLTPGGGEGLFVETGVPRTEPRPEGHGDPRRLMEIGAKYGMTILGPSYRPEGGVLPYGACRLPRLLTPDAGEAISCAGFRFTLKATGGHTAGAYSAIELAGEPGAILPGLRSDVFEMLLYVLSGVLRLDTEDATEQATRGATVLLPCRTRATLRVEGASPLRMLLAAAPAGIEAPLRTAAASSNGGSWAADLCHLAQLGPPHGLSIEV